MLTITVPGTEFYDESKNEFLTTKDTKITLEHSLVSISKWESKWGIPFLSNKERTSEQTIDYIRCMTLTQNVDPNIYYAIPDSVMKEITDYIAKPMTATWFSKKDSQKVSREVVTSEIIYYWMISLNIPVDFQKWHLNRLLTLIKVCNTKNAPKKNMTRNELLTRNNAVNAERRKQLNTKG